MEIGMFIADMRGKGHSTPAIKDEKEQAMYGMMEITEVTIAKAVMRVVDMINNAGSVIL